MNHFSNEQWKKYVKNELDENVREVYDHHLYSCDQCLEVYLQAVAEEEEALPVLSNEDEFTELVMSQVTASKKPDKKAVKKVKPFYQKAIFHYTIAAGMTFLLMTTGVFQSLTKFVDTVQSPNIYEKPPSITEGIVNKTFAWIDSFDINNKEANK